MRGLVLPVGYDGRHIRLMEALLVQPVFRLLSATEMMYLSPPPSTGAWPSVTEALCTSMPSHDILLLNNPDGNGPRLMLRALWAPDRLAPSIAVVLERC